MYLYVRYQVQLHYLFLLSNLVTSPNPGIGIEALPWSASETLTSCYPQHGGATIMAQSPLKHVQSIEV